MCTTSFVLIVLFLIVLFPCTNPSPVCMHTRPMVLYFMYVPPGYYLTYIAARKKSTVHVMCGGVRSPVAEKWANISKPLFSFFVRYLHIIVAEDKQGQSDLPPFPKSRNDDTSWYMAAQRVRGCTGHDGSAAIYQEILMPRGGIN